MIAVYLLKGIAVHSAYTTITRRISLACINPEGLAFAINGSHLSGGRSFSPRLLRVNGIGFIFLCSLNDIKIFLHL